MSNTSPTIRHVAFIMDGNRRWARAKGLSIKEGHEAGYEKLKKIGEWCLARNIPYVTVYALSNENLKRSEEEVGHLFWLLKKAMREGMERIKAQGFKINVIGRWRELPKDLADSCAHAMEETAENTNGVMNIALNYSGRNEIVDAVRRAIAKNGDVRDAHDITKELDTSGSPDPDLVIRTSGEQRLSGFLLWQTAYAELYFVQKHWPDFTEADLDEALAWYNDRDRRYGA